MNHITKSILPLFLCLTVILITCEEDNIGDIPIDPNSADIVSVDRFSEKAATLMKRSENILLPESNEPIDFDFSDFITQAYGPDEQIVKYYNFDVQPLTPAPIYVLFKKGETEPLEDQLNIIDAIPGVAGYNDFKVVYKVTVPDDYLANTVTSYSEIIKKGYSITKTNEILNCPVVPYGSTANIRLGDESNSIDRGWYKDKVVYYFSFKEKRLITDQEELIPKSSIYVTFNLNPDNENSQSAYASGIKLETGSLQSHNVIATLPDNTNYSPLWSVYIYDNTDFYEVSDLESAQGSNILFETAMYINCPVVYIED